MHTPTNQDLQPLVLLDVDGVINDLEALHGTERPWRTDLVESNGFVVFIPHDMPALIQHLTDVAEVWWCTTWRHHANREIASHLGIDPLPVITDGSTARSVTWKAAASRDLVTTALHEGRDVYWIEDFYGAPPRGELPEGVVFIDTTKRAPKCVLTPDDLPEHLIAADLPSGLDTSTAITT